MAHGIQRLCEELGCPLEGQASDALDLMTNGPTSSLKSQLDELINMMRVKEHTANNLQSTLIEALEVSKASSAERSFIGSFSRTHLIFSDNIDYAGVPDMEAVAGMIERQRQEQEATLRAIASGMFRSSFLTSMLNIDDRIIK